MKPGSAHLARTLTLALALVALSLALATPPPHEQQRIERLLDALAADHNSHFVRNATAYEGGDAARFLRAKLRAQGQGIVSAEAFIEQIASRSSTTGQPYRVCSPGGPCVDASVYLRALLAELPAAR
jgi:hypothetical protein